MYVIVNSQLYYVEYQQLLYVILPSSSLQSSKKGDKIMNTCKLLYMQVYHHSILYNRAFVLVERGQRASAKPEVSRQSIRLTYTSSLFMPGACNNECKL